MIQIGVTNRDFMSARPRQKERRRAATTPLNADLVAQRVSICHNFQRPTQAFGAFGHSCERRAVARLEAISGEDH
jgi:hypothetical protein